MKFKVLLWTYTKSIIYIKKGSKNMTTEQILQNKKARLATLEQNPKNIKCPGVLRKLRREVRNLEQ